MKLDLHDFWDVIQWVFVIGGVCPPRQKISFINTEYNKLDGRWSGNCDVPPFLWKLAALDHFVLNLSQRKNASINIITSAISDKNSIIFHRQLLVPLIIYKQGCHSKNPLFDSNAQNWHLPLPSFHLEKVWSLLTDGKVKPQCSHTSCGSQFWEFRRTKTTCRNWLKTDRHNEFETCSF